MHHVRVTEEYIYPEMAGLKLRLVSLLTPQSASVPVSCFLFQLFPLPCDCDLARLVVYFCVSPCVPYSLIHYQSWPNSNRPKANTTHSLVSPLINPISRNPTSI